MKYPATLGENGPGGYGKQWLCITAPNFSLVSPIQGGSASKATAEKSANDHPALRPAPAGMLRLPEAAKQYGVPYKTLYYAVKSGKLPAVMLKGDYLVSIANVVEFVDTKWRGRKSA